MEIHVRGVRGGVAGRLFSVDGFVASALSHVGGMSAAECGEVCQLWRHAGCDQKCCEFLGWCPQRALGKGEASATVGSSEC
eukprot:6186524-Pleurochrysis_carterae.AAC.2